MRTCMARSSARKLYGSTARIVGGIIAVLIVVIVPRGLIPPEGSGGDVGYPSVPTDIGPKRSDSIAGPSPRNGHDLAYDMRADRVILFGGFDGTVSFNETWAFDLDANSWSDMKPAVAPVSRRSHGMAYDAQSDLIVLFGGVDANTKDLGDTWVYDFNANTWTQKFPSLAPLPDHAFKMVYDQQSDRVVLSGSGPTFSDTWLYNDDTNTWEMKTQGPSAADHGLAYDVGSDRTVSFGGYDASLVRKNETWTYD